MANISYQAWYQFQTYPIWDIPLTTDNGNEDLTNISVNNITMIFRNTSTRPSTDTVGTGTFYIKNTNPGELLYKPSIADVASTFTGFLIVRIVFPPSYGPADLVAYDPVSFTISA